MNKKKKRKDPMGQKDLMGEDMFVLLLALVFVALVITATVLTAIYFREVGKQYSLNGRAKTGEHE